MQHLGLRGRPEQAVGDRAERQPGPTTKALLPELSLPES